MAIARWTSSISSTLVNDAEFAYSNNRINITPGGTNPGLLNQMAAAFHPLFPESLKNAHASTPTIWGGLGAYGSGQNIQSIAPWSNSLDLYTFRDDISKVVGTHALKVGVFLGYDGKNEDTATASTERPTFSATGVDNKNGGFDTTNPLADVLLPNNVYLLSEVSTNLRSQLRWRDYEVYAGDTWKIMPRVTLNYGVRYSILTPTFQPNNQITSFQPQLYDPSKPASDACNGLWVAPGTDPCGAANKLFGTAFSSGTPGPNKYLVNVNHHLVAPRVGIAWDVHGDGKTAIRLGAGQFFQRERVSRYTLVSNAPFSLSANNVSRTLGGPTPASVTGSVSPSGGYDPSAILPNSIQWNATIEQELAKNTVFQMSYVGDRGIHLTSNYDINAVAPANQIPATFAQGGAQTALRRFSNFGSALTYWTHQGDSNYHSLQALFRTQLGGFRLQAAYTWSHSIADVLTDNSDGGNGIGSFTNPLNPSFDRGNSATNRPNIFVANGTYFLPSLKGHSQLVKQALGSWELGGITSADSGNSLTGYQNAISDTRAGGTLGALDFVGIASNQRPFLSATGSCNSGAAGASGDQVINPNAFTLIGYHLGTLDPNIERRGSCSGPKLVNTDLSIDKNWHIKERFTVQFRLDAFDALNHANFRGDQINLTNPFTTVGCGTTNCSATNNVVTSQVPTNNFGKATGVVGNAGRQLQYGLHVEF